MAVSCTVLLGVSTLLYVLYRFANRNLNYWKDLGVPYMKNALPFFGNTLCILTRTTSISDFKLHAYKYFDGKRFGGYLMNQKPVFLPVDPELVHTIFVKDFNHFEDRLLPINSSGIISNGLFSQSGDRWRTLRHKLTPIFTSSNLKNMFSTIKECSDEVVSHIKENNVQDAKDICLKFGINVSGNLMFAIKVNAHNDIGLGKEILNATNAFFTPSPKGLLFALIQLTMPSVGNFFKVSTIPKETDQCFNNVVKDMIKQRQNQETKRNDCLQLMLDNRIIDKYYMKNKDNDTNNLSLHTDEPEDKELLNELKIMRPGLDNANLQELFTDTCIAAQAFAFIGMGSETLSNALSFVLYELSANLDVQTKLQKEVDETINAFGFNYDSIKKMTYLDQVLNETMRKYPLTGGLLRVCTKDYRVPETNIILKKGTMVTQPILGLHMDPKYFPNPERFDPERFRDPDSMPKNVFYPFGAGPRMCIAMRLAMLEMEILVVTLLLNFNIRVNKKTKQPLVMNKTSITLKPIGGIWVQFEKRQK